MLVRLVRHKRRIYKWMKTLGAAAKPQVKDGVVAGNAQLTCRRTLHRKRDGGVIVIY